MGSIEGGVTPSRYHPLFKLFTYSHLINSFLQFLSACFFLSCVLLYITGCGRWVKRSNNFILHIFPCKSTINMEHEKESRDSGFFFILLEIGSIPHPLPSAWRRPDRIVLLDKPPANSAFLPSRASICTRFPTLHAPQCWYEAIRVRSYTLHNLYCVRGRDQGETSGQNLKG